MRKETHRSRGLRELEDRVLEVADLESLAGLLATSLPRILGVQDVHILLWDRKLDSFQTLSAGETHMHDVLPSEGDGVGNGARYVVVDGELIETPERPGRNVVVPLMARSGLVGVLLFEAPGAGAPFTTDEAAVLSALARGAAIAIENQAYLGELLRSERMAALGTMAGMLAHDLRGPMTVIRGWTETLADPALSLDERRSRVELVLNMVDRLERMTGETLEYARGTRLARRTVRLGPLLEDLSKELAREIPGLEIVPTLRAPEDAEAYVDTDKLLRALGNIARNAVEAMGGRGRVHLSGETGDRGEIRLVVRDEGPGIPEAVRLTLFEPFVTHGKKGGTGLGLAIARRFIEEHGGALEVLSDGPGAAFLIRLPGSAPAPPV